MRERTKRGTQIQLSDHFTYGRLMKFTLPSIIMMIFMSIYGVIDGLFVSNIVGSNALSSINIIYPVFMIIGAFGFMLGTGGSAEVARTLGEGQKEKANQYFSMLIYCIIVIGIVLGILGILFMRPIARLMGASDLLIEDCVVYGTIMVAGVAAFMLQTSFQSFFIVAEKPHLGLIFSMASGVINIILDFLFVYVLRMGIAGAAIATVCGYMAGGVVPLLFFLRPNSSKLRLGKTRIYPKTLLNSCTNGSSEMMSNISQSIVTILYNLQLMRLAGEDGVAAITVIMYVNFIFVAIFIGFSIGTAPVISFHYGADNKQELKNVYQKSIQIIGIMSLAMTALGTLLAGPAALIFVGKNPEITSMTTHGLRVFALSFLFSGLNIFGSSYFTALCNGKISALISFLRTLVLQCLMLLVLPALFQLEGVWAAVVVAEVMAFFITMFFLRTKGRAAYNSSVEE